MAQTHISRPARREELYLQGSKQEPLAGFISAFFFFLKLFPFLNLTQNTALVYQEVK